MNDDRPVNSKGNLSSDETAALLRELNDGIAGQVPLPAVFRALADDISDSRLQAVAERVSERLESGDDLPAALDALEHVVPSYLRQTVAVGVESGNLTAMLRGLAEGEVARREMRRGLWSVLCYPLLVLVLLLLLLTYIFVILCPMFEVIFADFDLDLPSITIFFVGMSHYMPWVIAALMALGIVTALVLIVPSRLMHWLSTSIPLVGRALLWSGQHEFASMMATLTTERVPVVDALDCTANSLRDRNVARAARTAQAKCKSGQSLGEAMSESIHFDRTLTSLVSWGEANNRLPIALREAAATYLEQMALYSQFLERIVPPVMLILVAVVLFFTVTAFMLPLVELINGLTG